MSKTVPIRDPTDIADFSALVDDPDSNDNSILPTLVPDDMPLLIAPSSWEFSQGTSWIDRLEDGGNDYRDAIDIAASHNTNRDSGSGSEQEFADQARETLGDGVAGPLENDVEIWNTELHGWKSTNNTDEVTSSHFMFDARASRLYRNQWLARDWNT